MVDFGKVLEEERSRREADSKFRLSTYQEAIRDWTRNETGSAAIDAKAGSGKTSTLVRVVAPELRGRANFCAFNKHIAEELGSKLPRSVSVSTIHSSGFRAVKRRHPGTQVDADKSKKLVREALDRVSDLGRNAAGKTIPGAKELLRDAQAAKDVWSKSVKLADLCRSTLTDPKDEGALVELASEQDVELVGAEIAVVSSVVADVLAASRRTAAERVDFADMIWLPAVDDGVRLDPFEWVLVDEAQDLSAAQLATVRKMLAPGGRLLAVGDPRQAIYAFAGADAQSFAKVVQFAGGRTLPLNVCYRCPTSHLDLARAIVPEIESAPGAAVGTVRTIHDRELSGDARSGDLVVCRLTAPLVSLCLRLVRGGTPAFVRGQDLAASLRAIVLDVVKRRRGAPVSKLLSLLDDWLADRFDELDERKVAEDAPIRIALQDKAAVVRSVALTLAPSAPVSDLDPVFVELFKPRANAVVLSTVHRAKGLEADRVYIAREDKMPLPFVKRPSAVVQEWNLRYVALTRAKKDLVFLNHEDEDEEVSK